MECNLFLKKINATTVRRAMLSYLKDNSLEIFVKKFINEDNVPQKTRYKFTKLDSLDDIQKAILSFNDAFELAKIEVIDKNPSAEAALENLQKYVYSILHVDLDESLSGSTDNVDTFIEVKTEKELKDVYVHSYETHMADIYGVGAHDIKITLEKEFGKNIISAAYRDEYSGDLITKDNIILNKNIQDLKNRYYNTVVRFLQLDKPMRYSSYAKILKYILENKPEEYKKLQNLEKSDYSLYKKERNTLVNKCLQDLNRSQTKVLKPYMADEKYNFIGPEYYSTLESFYQYIQKLKKLGIFDDLLILNSREAITQTDKKQKSSIYESIIDTLKSNEEFSKRLNNAYKTKRSQIALKQLYIANHLSPYYRTIKNIIHDLALGDTKIGNTPVDSLLQSIEEPEVNLLEATKAYTSLKHFDTLLKMANRNIEINENLEGSEFVRLNKYSHHIDTSNQRKNWQTSESIDSESHTASLVKELFEQIDIFDYKTDTYLNKSVTTTSFIVAARNLMNDVLLGHVTWLYDLKSATNLRVFQEFIDHFKNFHDNPTRHFLKILETLFDTRTGANRKPLYESIGNKMLLTDYDLNILYSVYHSIFNKNNEASLINKEHSKFMSSEGLMSYLVNEFSGMVDRNVNIDYLEVDYDYNEHKSIIKMKRKYYNNLEVIKHIKEINAYANRKPTLEEEKKLSTRYEFKINEGLKGYNKYSIQIGSEKITLDVPSSAVYSLLYNDPGTKFEGDLFIRLNNIDLVHFRDKLLKNPETLSTDEKTLYNILQFIEDTLGIKMISNASENLKVLEIFKAIYNPNNSAYNKTSGTHILGDVYLMPLMQLAMRAMYVRDKYESLDPDESLREYLESNSDLIYLNYKNNIKSKIFSSKFNDVKYTIVSNYDTVLEMWADAHSMLTGEASKSTTKDNAKNNIPNNSVSKLGSLVHYYFNKQTDIHPESNVGSLFFVLNTPLIKNIFHDLEVKTGANSKQVKNFSSGELFYHAIFNKFWRNYLDTGNIIVLPTVYSDKTTFLNYEINTKFVGKDKLSIMDYESYKGYIIDQYTLTVGRAYKEIWKSTKRKLQAIADLYNLDKGTNLSFKEVLHKLNEPQLLLLGKRLNLDLELDKDYRIIKTEKGPVVAYNEELEYYSEILYNDKKKLEKYLEKLKTIFVDNLIESNTSFLVLNYKDDIENYLDAKKINDKASSKNIFIDIILSLYKKEDRVKFFKDWVDAKTGKLILAKQNGHNILDSIDSFNKEDSVELNPILDKFFYIEGFVSNNIRLSLTGSEINHPDKAFNTKYTLFKTKDAESLSKEYKYYYTRTIKEALNIIHNTANVGDLYKILYEDKITGRVKDLLNEIYEDSLLTMTNVSLGTLFKRNVIIPATLQYCLQNNINGISKKIKCAVIRDEPADVWNYRGDHEKPIDSADGAAWIDPFLSILENKSLGSLAVGFIKKPIWHSYDTSSGTAFLAKFATDTITNEVMNASINSHTNMYNMFKKMTNLQWLGDVDLLEAIGFNKLTKIEDRVRWFNTAILGNSIYYDKSGALLYTDTNKLLYRNKYGELVNIVGFGKSNTEKGPIYYTDEKLNTIGSLESKKVYHIFYDEVHEDGTKEKSIHKTFDTWNKAAAFLEKTPTAHTINSLFELHTALGGLNNINKDGKGSEFVNEVVVNFMNSIGHLRSGYSENDIIDQEAYEQPLKNYHIGYALNNTSVKNGAKNINLKEAWYDDTELNYFDVDSDGLGMLMNADHDIIDSELTEFSLVITATAAYGYTYGNTNEIFLGLAYTAIEASKNVLEAVDKFLLTTDDPTAAKSDLYDAIGRIIFVNRSIKDKENLQGIIMEAVNKIFYKRSDHTDDIKKIPFSDANVYSDFISTLASTITKQSIKRKHPGSGCVMAPGFNIIQYFEVDGFKYNAPELLQLALQDYKNELISILQKLPDFNNKDLSLSVGDDIFYLNTTNLRKLEELIKTFKQEDQVSYDLNIEDLSKFNKHLIQNYLNKRLGEAKVFEDRSWYMPSDIVNILYKNPKYTEQPEEGLPIEPEYVTQTIDLDSEETYYKFKDGLFECEHEYNVSISTDYKKGKYSIALNEDKNQRFILEPEIIKNPETGKNEATGYYNIHFKTGNFNEQTQRRTLGDLNKELKLRLFNAAIETLPLGATLRLSPTTSEQINTGIGGLTKGSVAGFLSIFELDARHKNVKLERIGEGETVTYFDNKNIPLTKIVYMYKKVSLEAYSNKYQVNVTNPHNLRPASIRWKYLKDGHEVYMNIFDAPVIKNAYINPSSKDSAYRELILKILNNLNEGIGIDVNGNQVNIIEGSFENSLAELVMSNLHKEKFGIKNESLNEVLRKGRNFFLPNKRDKNKLNTPHNSVYDIAFLKDSGKHTLISLGAVNTNEYISEKPFNLTDLTTNEDGDIYYTKRNRPIFKVGKWVDYSDKVTYDNGKFIDSKTKEVLENQDLYRLPDSDNALLIEKRIDFVKRYNFIDKYSISATIGYKKNTLYQIADISEIEEAFGNKQDALKQRRKILANMYLADNYRLAYVNADKVFKLSKFDLIRSSLSWLLENKGISENVKNLLSKQLDTFVPDTQNFLKKAKNDEQKEALIKNFKDIESLNNKNYNLLLTQFFEVEADKKWASFLDSLQYIASRIPALTLLSFMSMKLVGWTENSKNMAYVSHFLTYLLGSDYDIDKAYIMSLSYDDNGVYIGWSNLFNYTSYETLEASKTLPVPKGRKVVFDTNEGAEVTDKLEILKTLSKDSAKYIKILAQVIKEAEAHKFKIKNQNPSNEDNTILNLINSHELYVIPANIAEAAYKNVASANIYAVIDDVRNRDLAYTAISMDILKDAAAHSPKGNLAATLNMLNPLTKYIMLYLNLVGKDVISIAANGEKVWFNAFYYWTHVLKYGSLEDIDKLKFLQTLTRILGRAKHLKNLRNNVGNSNDILTKTVTHLPDLNYFDKEIKEKLLEQFDATEGTLAYKEVDLLISLLLSAATDNAKELILAKINAGTNFAKMYVYTIMMGFNIDDIVAFMTSPVAEFIDKMASPNIFQQNDDNNYAVNAINLALGKINSNIFLHGSIDVNSEEGEHISSYNKNTYVLREFNNLDDNIILGIKTILNLTPEDKIPSLQDAMLGLILYGLQNNLNLDIEQLLDNVNVDQETHNYLRYCSGIYKKLLLVRNHSDYSSYEEYINDAKEFNKIFNLASEISTISSKWLGLNQGLPTDEFSLLKRLSDMSKIVSDRESALELNVTKIFPESYKKSYKKITEEQLSTNRDKIIRKIIENNPAYSYEDALEILKRAYEAQIINNFNITKYLLDDTYKKLIIEYYGLIKGTFNVFDMMEKIPHYLAILKCLKAQVTANNTLSAKSNLINQLLNSKEGNSEKISEDLLRGAIRYVDSLNIYNYFKTLPKLAVGKTITGFDSYFRTESVDGIELNSLNGIATLKHWVENEYLDELLDQFKNPNSPLYQNGFIKHLNLVTVDSGSNLATDIDLMNPNVTTSSRLAYDEILRGIAELSKVRFNPDPEYSIADIFLLYNLAVNQNLYGSERLTTVFKILMDPNNQINKYLAFIGNLDYSNDTIDYNYNDFLVNSAKLINSSLERLLKDLYIKVKDPVEGFILKLKDFKSNEYKQVFLIPSFVLDESPELFFKRLQNFSEYCPLELIFTHKNEFKSEVLKFNDYKKLTKIEQDKLKQDLINMLKDYSISNRILIYKICD